VVLDSREAAHGSTAGNTGLFVYELDVPLHRLALKIGTEPARRVFRRCCATIDRATHLARALPFDCGFRRRTSLHLAASPRHVPLLQSEFRALRAAGLEVEWWSRSRLRRESSLPHPAAILTRDAAEIDAYRFTYGLLQAVAQAGTRVHDRTKVTRWKMNDCGVELRTARGARVRARELVVAAGYEAGRFLPRPVGRLRSTFALATEPVASFDGWPSRGALMWDTADPYLYLRTTADNRVLIGGGDEPYQTAGRRDRLLGTKAASLFRRLEKFFPAMTFERHSAWAGTFGATSDGLPFIGRHAGIPRTWFALGFGGNGMAFSVIAAELLRDALRGRDDPDAKLFGFGRPGISR
jgi:glycine/D-amino acid oxidase-like deaminating enzyme